MIVISKYISLRLFSCGPTLLCSGRRWRGLWAGRDLWWSWHAVARLVLETPPAAPLKAGRWAFIRTATPSVWIGGVRNT